PFVAVGCERRPTLPAKECFARSGLPARGGWVREASHAPCQRGLRPLWTPRSWRLGARGVPRSLPKRASPPLDSPFVAVGSERRPTLPAKEGFAPSGLPVRGGWVRAA